MRRDFSYEIVEGFAIEIEGTFYTPYDGSTRFENTHSLKCACISRAYARLCNGK